MNTEVIEIDIDEEWYEETTAVDLECRPRAPEWQDRYYRVTRAFIQAKRAGDAELAKVLWDATVELANEPV